jgi:tRNAThr (cytosine32-N3)-methyltransferase
MYRVWLQGKFRKPLEGQSPGIPSAPTTITTMEGAEGEEEEGEDGITGGQTATPTMSDTSDLSRTTTPGVGSLS